jgi:hypothetical protein
MKTYRNLALTSYAVLIVITGLFGYIIEARGCTQTAPAFYNGQILLPDYVHADTLIVTDAEYLNECMKDGKFKTDGDIREILNETTEIHNPLPYGVTRAYTFTLEDGGTSFYQGTKYVGFIPFDSTSAFDSLMIEDNR